MISVMSSMSVMSTMSIVSIMSIVLIVSIISVILIISMKNKIMENKIFINLFIILFSVGVVFFFRMESRKTSYAIQKKYEVLKNKRKEHQRIIAQYKTKTGERSFYKRSEEMVALRAAKNQQIVMFSNKIMVSN